MLDEKDLQAIAQLIAPIQKEIETMQADIAALKRDSATKEDLSSVSKRLDTLERTTATKDDLAAMATKEDLSQVLTDSKIMQEGYFGPQFGLLADGLKLVQEKMLPMEALDDAEDRLDVLEAVVKNHSREIRELKKAQ